MWNYGVFVRGDVPEALGIDPTSIKTTEELLDFMQKAKDYGFKDVNGNDCIVATTFHNGWSYDNYLQSYNEKKPAMCRSDWSPRHWCNRRSAAHRPADPHILGFLWR